jgi:hypothetical protein
MKRPDLLGSSDVGEDALEGPRHAVEIERIHEQACVSDLSAPAASQPTPELLLHGPTLPGSLFLQRPERAKITLSIGDLFDRLDAESTDQLVLQVFDAHVETARFHLGAGQVGAEAAALEAAPEVVFLSYVAETCYPNVEPPWAVAVQEAPDRLRTSDRHNGNALRAEIPTAARGESFERALVTDPFHEQDGTRGICHFVPLGLLHAAISPVPRLPRRNLQE